MAYRTYIRRRKNRGRQEWIARLIYQDEVTGADRELSKSAKSRSEAQLELTSLENKFLAGGVVSIQSNSITMGELLDHCLKTRYYEPIYDGEGRKKGGVRGFKTIESHIKGIAAFLALLRREKARPQNMLAE
jgi:hypothetical protein